MLVLSVFCLRRGRLNVVSLVCVWAYRILEVVFIDLSALDPVWFVHKNPRRCVPYRLPRFYEIIVLERNSSSSRGLEVVSLAGLISNQREELLFLSLV